MTASDLKYNITQADPQNTFFSRDSMKFAGDTMRNFGCRSAEINGQPVWELYRKRPVKHGLQSASYFAKDTFKRVFGKVY